MVFRNHSLSKWFVYTNNGCGYNARYLTGQTSRSIASIDTFTFPSNNQAPEQIGGIVFGCGINNPYAISPNTAVGGIMGMDRSPISLVRQLGNRTMPRFSYCLLPFDYPIKSSFLRFGNEAVIKGEHIQTTRTLQGTSYELNLRGISIAGRRLGLPWGTFLGGCLVDSGSSLSLIQQRAYNVILNTFRSHFDQFNNLTKVTGHPRDLCYKFPDGFRSFPSMTFHFQGANLEIGRTTLFRFVRNTFCLELVGHPKATFLGAYQQQNIRLLYDLDKSKISFLLGRTAQKIELDCPKSQTDQTQQLQSA